jgi:hypothetical protein
VVLPLLVACGRWVPNSAYRWPFQSPTHAYETTLRVLRDRGYAIEVQDDQRQYIRAVAFLDGDVKHSGPPTYGPWSTAPPHATGTVTTRLSYLNFQVDSSGQLTLRVFGYHVRDGNTRIHAMLEDEVKAVVHDIARRSGVQVAVIPSS